MSKFNIPKSMRKYISKLHKKEVHIFNMSGISMQGSKKKGMIIVGVLQITHESTNVFDTDHIPVSFFFFLNIFLIRIADNKKHAELPSILRVKQYSLTSLELIHLYKQREKTFTGL